MISARTTRFTIFLFAIFAFLPKITYSADYYWVNGSGNWNDATHWSLTSGGSSAGSIPGENDNTIFNDFSFSEDFHWFTLPQVLRLII